jgi:Transposase DDE domain
MQSTISTLELALTDDFTEQTSSAFLVAALHWAADHGFWQPFARLLAIPMKIVTYSPLQKIQTLIASILIGCAYMKDVNTRLVPDRVAAASLGLDRFPDQSQLNLLLRRLDAANIGELEAIHAEHLARFASFPALPHWHNYLFVDIDQLGLVATGKTYQFTALGYFPHRRGERGYQVGAAFLGSSQVTLALRLDPGNTHCTTRFHDLLAASEARCAAAPGCPRRVYRVDAGYGGWPQLDWLLAHDYLFLAKAPTHKPQAWAAQVAPAAWQEVPDQPGVRVAELGGERGLRRIVCARTDAAGKTEYAVLVTNLPAAHFDAVALWELYNERQTIEAFFKTGRGVYGLSNLRSRQFLATYGFLWLVFITHNLLQWVKADLFGAGGASVGTRELVEQVGRIPARRERTAQGWRLLLPSQDRLARWFVQLLRPQWCQLALPLRL